MKRGLLLVIGLALLGLVAVIGRGSTAQATDASDPLVTYPAGWSIVGGPPGTVFSQATNPLYTRQPTTVGTYDTWTNTTAIRPGWGYWAYFWSTTTVNIPSGGYWLYAVWAPQGKWIMVGNPCGDGPAWVIGAPRVVQYQNGAWVHNPVLGVGDGAFAKVYRPGGGAVMVIAPACSACAPQPPDPPPFGTALPSEVDVSSFDEVEQYLQLHPDEYFFLPCQPCPPHCQAGVCPSPNPCDYTYVGLDEGEGSTYYIGSSSMYVSISVPEDGQATVSSYLEGGMPVTLWSGSVSEGITVLGPYTEGGPAGETWIELEFTPEGALVPCVAQTYYYSGSSQPY